MLSGFFIDRPVFAFVVSIVLMLVGGISLPLLPVEQYPEIAPPVVQVSTSYPGADAATIVDSVTAPLEQEINGVEGMIYMKSTTEGSGRVSIDVTFELGTDPDQANVYTQNRVSVAEPRLPQEVRNRGVKVSKRSPSLLMIISVRSELDEHGEPIFDYLALSNYMTLSVRDRLARAEGVSDVFMFGQQDFSMRVWLDPDRLSARNLTTVDVLNALREQNVQVAAGQIGAPPAETESGFQFTVNTQGRLETAEQFEAIILKVGEDQQVVRLADVARVELGAESYQSYGRLSDRNDRGEVRLAQPAATVGIYQLPGSNATAVAAAVKEVMAGVAEDMPEGMSYAIPFNFVDFVDASIREVVITLLIAVVLVVLITYLFLQNLRATLVPAITIPVSLIATFGVMLAVGYSINLLTLFGLILAIGIVVDDAIVVVENVARRIDAGQPPRQAAKAAMGEVTGALIATTLVVLAVFIPAMLLPGMTGVLYRQFAVTIAVATLFSTVNALTLSPVLCSLLLRPGGGATRFPLFTLFNRSLDGARSVYLRLVNGGIRAAAVTVLIFAGLCAAAVVGLRTTPTGFLPDEDMGYFFINIQLPDAAKLERTEGVLRETETILANTPGVARVIGINGFSILGGSQAPNNASCIVVLDHWDQRQEPHLRLGGVVRSIAPPLAAIREGLVFPFTPPPILGLGAAGGFSYELQDRGSNGYEALEDVMTSVVTAGNSPETPRITRLFSGYRARVPQLFVDIDTEKAQRLGVPPAVYQDTLQTNLGGAYVNDFNAFNRVYRVYAQADARFRAEPEDIGLLQVRNKRGDTLPLDTFVEVREVVGPQSINRFNLYPSASITGQAAPGFSSGAAITGMAELSERVLQPGFSYEWSGQTYQELAAGNAAPIAFALGFVMVFLVLAAQYESWSTPLAILLTVPLGVLGAILGIRAMGLPMDVYVQIGFVLLISLVAKNAILIVEFARQLRQGVGSDEVESAGTSQTGKPMSIRDAAMTAARLRFRPILMTAFSFILGTLPLLLASGAGAGSRIALGTTVFYGTLLATILGIVLVPVFFVVIQSMSERLQGRAADEPKP